MKKNPYTKQLFAYALALLLMTTATIANSQTYPVKGNNGWSGIIDETNSTSTDIDELKIAPRDSSNSSVWHVSPDGDDVAGDGSEDFPFASIQHGIDVSSNGDTVLVAPGTYLENVNFGSHDIVLASHYVLNRNPELIKQTIIDGGNAGTVVAMNYNFVNAELTGFSITNCAYNYSYAIYCGNSGNPITVNLNHLLVINNNSYNAPINLYFANSTIKNITCINNSCLSQAIIYSTYGTTTISNSIVSNNTGYGFKLYDQSNTKLIEFCDFYDNSLGNFYNTANDIGNVVTINLNGDSCDVFNNIFVDPLFLDFTSADYNLSNESPCIDSGNPETPPDPDFSPADMGAFYFKHPVYPYFTAEPNLGTIPFTVQFNDISFGSPTSWEWDLDGDGTIDSYEQNPQFEYSLPWSYNVSLTVSDGEVSYSVTSEDFIVAIAPVYEGTEIHIATNGNDLSGNGSEEFPFATIQHGIDVSSNGDTLLVAPGTYYEHINFIGKNILVSSYFIKSNDPSIIEQTVISGSGNGDIVTFSNYESSEARLTGLTIKNGSRGVVTYNSSPVLSHLIISNNHSNQNGGGVWAYNSGVKICYNKIVNNSAQTAYSGGGIFLQASDMAIIHNNEIANNSTSGSGSGGGIYMTGCSPTIDNNQILNNLSPGNGAGGGIYCNGSNSIIHHNLIAGNESPYGAGILCNSGSFPTLLNNTINNNLGDNGGGMRCRNNSSPLLINNIIWGNTATSSGAQISLGDATSNPDIYFCDIEGGIANFGLSNGAVFEGDFKNCIDSDPLFNEPGNGDFTLSNGSPCIDTGDPTQPEDPDLSVSDMGYRYFHLDFVAAFEANNTNGFPPFEVNFSDFSTGNPTSWAWDFDGDGLIDSNDENPSCIYNEFGKFSVTLTTSNASNEYTRTKTDYINIDFQHESILTSIEDVPDDQGGWVMVNFARSIYDNDPLQDWGEMYNIEMNSGHGWFNTGTVGAYGSDYYSAQVHTSFDSSQYINGLIDFRIIAIMQEGNYASAVSQGYSVDNLAPAVPDNMNYELLTNEIAMNWNPCPDFDFTYFAIYKSAVSGYFPDTPVSTTTQPAFTDQLTPGEVVYYVITAIDFHGNESGYSNEIETLPAIRWELKEGWSGISSFIEPSDENIENMFDKIESQLIIMQNENGMYWPGQNINTLGNWNMESGYQIKVSEDVNLSVTGTRTDNHALQMQAQWNLIPVLSECDADVAQLFDGTDLTIVKEVAGTGVYWPEFGINTLQVVQPGKAYFVLMNGTGVVTFLECDTKSAVPGDLIIRQPLDLPGSLPWQLPKPSSITHTIAIPSGVVSGIASGDVIGAFDEAGNCNGAVLWNNHNISITLFGDDPTTSVKDGFENNEPITFRLWNSETPAAMLLDVTFAADLPNPEMSFVENGLSAIASLKYANSGILPSAGNPGIVIIPNPAKDEFVLKLGVDDLAEGTLTIYTIGGQICLIERIEKNENHIKVDQLKPGIYILQIEATGIHSFRRLIIQ